MAYIANKPVRFDRDYKVGEVIPEGVIAPGMSRKLVEMGRILCVDLPQETDAEDGSGQPQEAAQDGTGSAPDDGSGADGTNTQASGEAAQDAPESAPGGESGGEFVCEVCGRPFSSQQALAAHSRSHKD